MPCGDCALQNWSDFALRSAVVFLNAGSLGSPFTFAVDQIQLKLTNKRTGIAMQVNIYEAKSHFSELISRALTGEEVVIAKSGKPLVRLSPIADAATVNGVRFGGLKSAGIVIGDDFDTPLSDDDLLGGRGF